MDNTVGWDTAANSLVLSEATNVQSAYQQAESLSTLLSPLTDVSPFMFAAATNCAVNAGDNLTIRITNFQTGLKPLTPSTSS